MLHDLHLGEVRAADGEVLAAAARARRRTRARARGARRRERVARPAARGEEQAERPDRGEGAEAPPPEPGQGGSAGVRCCCHVRSPSVSRAPRTRVRRARDAAARRSSSRPCPGGPRCYPLAPTPPFRATVCIPVQTTVRDRKPYEVPCPARFVTGRAASAVAPSR